MPDRDPFPTPPQRPQRHDPQQLGQFTKGAGGESAATAAGRSAHDSYPLAVGTDGDYRFNQAIPGTRLRPDAYSVEERVVRELKPDHPKAIQKGWRQVNNYKEILEEKFGGTWTAMVDTYKPD